MMATSDEISKHFVGREVSFGMCGMNILEPNISFEFVPEPIPHPSIATYAHPCPPVAWHVPTHAIQIAPMY